MTLSAVYIPNWQIHSGLAKITDSELTACEKLTDFVVELLDVCQLAQPLTYFGVSEGDLEILAAEAATQWTAKFNPRSIGPHGISNPL